MGNEIKPMSGRLAFLVLAVVAVLLGIGRFAETVNSEMVASVLSIIFGLVLVLEVMGKRFTNISKLTKVRGIAAFSGWLGLAMIVIGGLGILGVSIAALAGVQGFLLIATGVMIGLEAFM